MKATIAWLSACLCVLVFAPAACPGAEDAAARPNILLILADDVGVEPLGCYGGQLYDTPRLDALARSGERFTHCYAMPVCHPTRVCLLTGRYPYRLGNPRWGTFPRQAEDKTFAHVMKRAGYATAVAGKWQLTMMKNDLDHPRRLGFDQWCLFGWHEGPRYWQPLIYQNGAIRDDVEDRYGPSVYCEFLIDFMERNRERPFLAYYPMALCHDVTDDLDAPVPFGPGKDRYDSFPEMVSQMDKHVGILLDALERLKLREKTIVIFVGDNGTAERSFVRAEGGKYTRERISLKLNGQPVRGGKGELTDAGTHVPLIVRWPKHIAAGAVNDTLVDLSDFLPTLAELAHASIPAEMNLDGVSFASSLLEKDGGLLGADGQAREWAFAEHKNRYWVRDRRWKLYGDGRLFDISEDPLEERPIASDRGTSAEAQAARGRLEAAQRELGYPAGRKRPE